LSVESGVTISQEDIAILCSFDAVSSIAGCETLQKAQFQQSRAEPSQAMPIVANLTFQRGSMPAFHPPRTQNRSPLFKVAFDQASINSSILGNQHYGR
jgi:hypothetical protein